MIDVLRRFFERIAKTYRRERWSHMLRPLLATWYACAQQLGDVELGIRLLVEMLSNGKYAIPPSYYCSRMDAGSSDGENPSTIEEDLMAVLQVSPSNRP